MRSLSNCLIACSTLLLCSVLALSVCPGATEAAVRARTAATSVRLMKNFPSVICSERLSPNKKEISHGRCRGKHAEVAPQWGGWLHRSGASFSEHDAVMIPATKMRAANSTVQHAVLKKRAPSKQSRLGRARSQQTAAAKPPLFAYLSILGERRGSAAPAPGLFRFNVSARSAAEVAFHRDILRICR